MANKRKAIELTGGTGDVNPQWFSVSAVQSGNDVFEEVSFDLPTNPSMLGQRPNKAVVMEFLRVQFIWALDVTQSPSTPQRWTAYIRLGLSPIGIGISGIQTDTRTLAVDQSTTVQAGAGSTVMYAPRSTVYDLTDGAGHGLIVASKSLTVGISTLNTVVTNRVTCRILYRYKEIGITEFITMAQFQQ